MASSMRNAELEDSLFVQNRDFVNKGAISGSGRESLAKAF